MSQLSEQIWSGSNTAFVHAPPSESARFLKPVTDKEVQRAEACCVPKTTNKANNWAVYAGVNEQLIVKRTGHRSVDGIRLYKRISDDQQRSVSAMLNLDAMPSKRPKLQPEIQFAITTDKENNVISTYPTAMMCKLNIIENETSLITLIITFFIEFFILC